MKRLLILTVGAALGVAACGTTASDATDTTPGGNATPPGAARQPPDRPVYRAVTIPVGTTLPLALMTAVASDTSAVEDAVTAELTRPVTIDGQDVLPAGARLTGVVTDVDDSARVKGKAMIAFRFTSLHLGDKQYDVQSATVSHVAPGTKVQDATKIGIGAGAGAIIGGVLGGKSGAATGAAVGAGAGTGVVLATKGPEVRLGPGADVTTELTAPLTVRIRLS
ncbi:MAG TPA: hypothetical protein VFO58_21600 [Vicinamibacterales bacterium]|nr:hypothetical protein [Vicinamibacterales bacterium]